MGQQPGTAPAKAAVEETGLKSGSKVEVTVLGRDLRVRQPLPVKRYRLEDLLAEMDRLGRLILHGIIEPSGPKRHKFGEFFESSLLTAGKHRST